MTSEPIIDIAQEVRVGEELNTKSLTHYLSIHFPEYAGPINVMQFQSGYSNLTYLLEIGEQEVVLRRSPFGSEIKSAHDMGREFKILSALENAYDRAPKPILYCEDASVLGAPFYIMERIEGVILRKEIPKSLSATEEYLKAISHAFVSNFAEIHLLDWRATELNDLANPVGYVKRQISGWIKRYQSAETESHDHVAAVTEWLGSNQPELEGAALIHNDYKFDNLVFDPEQLSLIKGVLDWEMATIGDPLMDLGTSLAYWVEANDPDELQALRFGPTHLSGCVTRNELVERYFQEISKEPIDVLFHYIYGLFKLAVIVQQIYKRYVDGHTQDPRFAHLNLAVGALSKTAFRAIQSKKISS